MRAARHTVLVALALAVAAVLPAGAASPGKIRGHSYGHEQLTHSPACTGNPQQYAVLAYSSGGQTAKAVYVLPRSRPRGVVVFDHGYSHTMYSWVRHMQRTAASLGVIAVTPDYRGQVDNLRAQSLPSSRGWRVAEGAVDTNTVARLFDKQCFSKAASGKAHNVLYSVSMGGNTAGLALAAKPKRQTGGPLFDEWIDVEGAANVIETYQGARRLAPVNTFAAQATADIEQEMGGSLEQKPQVFAERTVVNRTRDIVASGIKGVVMAHGYADGLVTHDISRQLQALLRAQGMPVDFRSFVTHSSRSEPGTTLDGYLPTGISSPFAGHASEASETQDVGVEGFRALAELYAGRHVSCRDSITDGRTGQGVRLSDGCS
ncbi:MAG: alpha/beta hydrolase family protein [Mycobacteriales bacterium]